MNLLIFCLEKGHKERGGGVNLIMMSNSPVPKDIPFTVISDDKKQQMHAFDKLEPANFLTFLIKEMRCSGVSMR